MKQSTDHTNIDPRIVLLSIPFLITGFSVWIGDTATFVRAPRNPVENACALLTVLGYSITRDRFSADIVAALLVIIALGIASVPIGFKLYRYLKWAQVKAMWDNQKTEQQMLNELHRRDS